MGGTQTDVAVVSGGRPVIQARGALCRPHWRNDGRSRLRAAPAVSGGDSGGLRPATIGLCVGPARPSLSCRAPAALPHSRAASAPPSTSAGASVAFAFPANPDSRRPPSSISRRRTGVWYASGPGARKCPRSCPHRRVSGAGAVSLAVRGLRPLAAFTPSYAMPDARTGNRDGPRGAAECGAPSSPPDAARAPRARG